MDMQKEARLVSGSIIEWCFDKNNKIEDKDYPSHLVNNLLQRQKGELIGKAWNFITKHFEATVLDTRGSIGYGCEGITEEQFKKAMKE